MHADIAAYNAALRDHDQGYPAIGAKLAAWIDKHLPEAQSKLWHAHPVWFIEGNPIVGYGKLKHCVRLLFWSGQSFDATGLQGRGSFKAAERRYTSVNEIDEKERAAWLAESRVVQWDYKHIVKRQGRLERLR